MAVHGEAAAPTLSKAAVNGTALVLTFNATLADSTPAAAAFTVSVTPGGNPTPTDVQVSGSAVTLTLGTAVTAGQTVTVSYNTANAGTTPLRDTGDNLLAVASFSDEAVTNSTPGSPSPSAAGCSTCAASTASCART